MSPHSLERSSIFALWMHVKFPMLFWSPWLVPQADQRPGLKGPRRHGLCVPLAGELMNQGWDWKKEWQWSVSFRTSRPEPLRFLWGGHNLGLRRTKCACVCGLLANSANDTAVWSTRVSKRILLVYIGRFNSTSQSHIPMFNIPITPRRRRRLYCISGIPQNQQISTKDPKYWAFSVSLSHTHTRTTLARSEVSTFHSHWQTTRQILAFVWDYGVYHHLWHSPEYEEAHKMGNLGHNGSWKDSWARKTLASMKHTWQLLLDKLSVIEPLEWKRQLSMTFILFSIHTGIFFCNRWRCKLTYLKKIRYIS